MQQHWLTRTQTIRRLWVVFALILAATLAAQLFVAAEAHFDIERLFGFNAVYGFAACALMVIGAKAIGWLLKRPDDYYQRRGGDLD
jgi:uncharacterized membrane protein